MGLDKMDAAAAKVRKALVVVSLLEVAGEQVTREQIMDAVGVIKDHLQDAGAAIEEAYYSQEKPGIFAPALVQPRAPIVACLVPNSRPAQTPG
jgi:hypothetical protein